MNLELVCMFIVLWHAQVNLVERVLVSWVTWYGVRIHVIHCLTFTGVLKTHKLTKVSRWPVTHSQIWNVCVLCVVIVSGWTSRRLRLRTAKCRCETTYLKRVCDGFSVLTSALCSSSGVLLSFFRRLWLALGETTHFHYMTVNATVWHQDVVGTDTSVPSWF